MQLVSKINFCAPSGEKPILRSSCIPIYILLNECSKKLHFESNEDISFYFSSRMSKSLRPCAKKRGFSKHTIVSGIGLEIICLRTKSGA